MPKSKGPGNIWKKIEFQSNTLDVTSVWENIFIVCQRMDINIKVKIEVNYSDQRGGTDREINHIPLSIIETSVYSI